MPVGYVGIDISKNDFHACLREGTATARQTFANNASGFDRFQRWVKNRKVESLHVCMEATGAYWLGLALNLHQANIATSVVNPARIKNFARSQLRRTKTDSVDAEIIADFCRTQSPSLWTPPAAEILELRALLTYREHLISERIRIRQIVATVHGAQIIEASTADHIAMLGKKIKEVAAQLRALLKQSPLQEQAGRLQTIPGIGWLTAAAILAHLPFEQLRNSKAAAAYAGLCPAERLSGTSVHGRPYLSKTGNADLRRALYMPAMSAARGSSRVAAFADRLKARGKNGKVVLAAVMRKLVTIAYAILKAGTTYTEVAPA